MLRKSKFSFNKKILIGILGQPTDMGKLHPYFVVKSKKEYGEGYQVRVTPKQLIQLQKRLSEKNLKFEEFFERDWRHFHLNCYLGSDDNYQNDALYHEGIAYEHEEYWSIYYENGSLAEYQHLKNDNYFIQNIYNININDLNKDIAIFFENWIKKQVNFY